MQKLEQGIKQNKYINRNILSYASRVTTGVASFEMVLELRTRY